MAAFARRATLLALLQAAVLVAGCTTARQRVTVDVVGDVPSHDARGRRVHAARRAEATRARSVEVVAGFPCPRGTVDHTRQCPTAPPRKVAIEPLVRHLGPPLTPAEVAGRMTAGYPRDPERRARVRAAYLESVRTRYRLYAVHVTAALREADWVEITDGDGRPRRFSQARIGDGLDTALLELADRVGDEEWARFEASWRKRRAPSAAAAPAQRPVEDPPPEQASPETAPVDGSDACRKACQLRWRACLARCRTTPVEGGAYDACTYECGATDADCRSGCRSGG